MTAPTREKIIEALKSVRVPGAKANIVELNQVQRFELEGSSLALEIALPELNAMLEKSIRYQVERSIQSVDSSLQILLQITGPEAGDISPLKKIGTLFAVASGKGGVGKSSTAVNLAVAFQQLGYKVGILDCDVYGPSIPTMLGVEGEKPMMLNKKIQPIEAHGLKLMSAGFLVEPGQSLVWRGPMLHKLIQQFAHDVDWGELDILVIDLPPGTGDAPLSLSQAMPLTGAIMVSSPQKVARIDVHRGVSMFNQVKVPILGVIENMSHFVCPHCQHDSAIFDQGKIKGFCGDLGIPYLGDIPIEPKIREKADEGRPFMTDFGSTPVGAAYLQIAKKLQSFVKSSDTREDPIKLVMS